MTTSVNIEGQKVFVSYRREDCLIHSSALVDGLALRLPNWNIFRDLDSIVHGTAWHDHIQREIEMCAVVLVLIGDDWLTIADGEVRRLDNPDDVLRQEIETALDRDVPVVPILVERARMPDASQLPEPIRGLARFHAMELTEHRWSRDIDELASALKNVVRIQSAPAESAANSIAIPKRVTEAWLRDNARNLSKTELAELVGVLRDRGWPDGWIIDYVFGYANADDVPKLRRPRGDAARAPGYGAQKRITEAFLARTVPELDGDSLAALVEIMERRGWSAGQIEDMALVYARADAVEPKAF